MNDFIAEMLRAGRFSAPSGYIRLLICGDQDVASGKSEIARFLRRGALRVKTATGPPKASRKRP